MTCVTVYYCVTFCVFDFLHTLAFVSASDIFVDFFWNAFSCEDITNSKLYDKLPI